MFLMLQLFITDIARETHVLGEALDVLINKVPAKRSRSSMFSESFNCRELGIRNT